MGLEGSELLEKMAVFDNIHINLSQIPNPISLCGGQDGSSAGNLLLSDDPANQMELLHQAQALLKKSILYQNVEQALQKSYLFRPNTYTLFQSSVDEDRVTSLHRDAAVNNLRFFNIFYGFKASTFAMTVNLLDRLLGKVKTNPRYLSCIATCCFYIAAKSQEEHVFIPSATELVKLSQCGGSVTDLQRMERTICEKLQYEMDAVTPLTFLQYFHEMFGLKAENVADQSVMNGLCAKLEVLMCHCKFSLYRAETLALALISDYLKDKDLMSSADQLSQIVELQYYCQITDCELAQCSTMIRDYIEAYYNQPSRLPRLQLTWTVSRRTLTKLKPSSRCVLDLAPIMEDEDLDSDDAGRFDSENDDVDIIRNKLKICPYFPRIEPDDQVDMD